MFLLLLCWCHIEFPLHIDREEARGGDRVKREGGRKKRKQEEGGKGRQEGSRVCIVVG